MYYSTKLLLLLLFPFIIHSTHVCIPHVRVHAQARRHLYIESVMYIWWQRIWNTDLQKTQQNRQISITQNVPTKQQSHTVNRCRTTTTTTTTTHSTSHQMPYSIHNCNNSRQSKCIRTSSTEQTVRMKSFCSVIILIHCFNVLVLSIASEQSTITQPQPCDRTRRVFTDVQGEISNGPFGSNYTQVKYYFIFISCPIFKLLFFFSFHSISNQTTAGRIVICCCRFHRACFWLD